MFVNQMFDRVVSPNISRLDRTLEKITGALLPSHSAIVPYFSARRLAGCAQLNVFKEAITDAHFTSLGILC